MTPKSKLRTYKWICYCAFMLLCVVIQTTILSGIDVMFCSPNLIPFIVAVISLRDGVEDGMIAGIAGGLLCDGLYSGYEAFYTITLVVLAFGICLLNTIMYWKNYGMSLLNWVVIVIPMQFLHYCIYMLLQGEGTISSLLYIIPGEILATLPFTPILYFIIIRIGKRFEPETSEE
ncbi:MAG: hypothetical protein E7473_09645 [Ruminococcaceae bacterium]|nr:hypothetical protein [Oscillospiraceae bacterium]